MNNKHQENGSLTGPLIFHSTCLLLRRNPESRLARGGRPGSCFRQNARWELSGFRTDFQYHPAMKTLAENRFGRRNADDARKAISSALERGSNLLSAGARFRRLYPTPLCLGRKSCATKS